MPLALENLNQNIPLQNTGGTGDHILVIEPDDLTAIPALSDTNLEAAGQIDATGITLAASKSWKRIECTLDKGMITSTKIGARGHGAFRNQASGHFSAPNGSAVGLANYWNNKKVIALVPERSTGKYRLLGTKTDPAFIQAQEFGTGEGPEGENAFKFTVESIGSAAPYVSGTVTLTSP